MKTLVKEKRNYLAPQVDTVEFKVEIGQAASAEQKASLSDVVFGAPENFIDNDVHAGEAMTEGNYFN